MINKKLKVGNVPNLRFPEFAEEWETKKLGEILEFKNGINATKEQYGSGYKFINVLDILNNEFITHDKIIGSVNVNEEIIDKFPVNYGDILFQRSSETREEVGTTSVYLDKDKTATFGGFVIRGKKNGEYEPIFLNKSLKTDLVRNQITSKSGGSTRYNIGQEILASVTLYFPSLNEQTKIASFLSLIDSRIQTQNKIIEQLETLIKGLCQKLILNQVPNKKINNCVSCHSSSLTESDVIDKNGIYPIYGATGVIAFTENSQINEDAILIIKDGSGVGKVQYASDKFSVIGTLNYLTVKPDVNLKYIFFCLKFFNFEKYKVGSGIPHIYFKDYGESLIFCPSLDEQGNIEKLLSSLDEKINLEKTLLKKYEIQKKNLLQNLFI